MVADILQGKTGFADVMFLLAVILFALDLVLWIANKAPIPFNIHGILIAGGLTALSLGWLSL